MIVKVFLTSLDLFLIEQTHLSPFAVGKLIDDWAPHVEGDEIVDTGTDVSSQCSKDDNEENVQRTAGSMIGGRCDNKF